MLKEARNMNNFFAVTFVWLQCYNRVTKTTGDTCSYTISRTIGVLLSCLPVAVAGFIEPSYNQSARTHGLDAKYKRGLMGWPSQRGLPFA